MTEAPRWRLISAHYLKVHELPDGTRCEWEHKETARESGRTVRKLFPVPILLDPRDPADHNYPGEIIVTHSGDWHTAPRDIIFEGAPTQEMEPLNDAASTITESLREGWNHPIETLPVNGGMSSQEQAFMERMMTSFAKEIGQSLPKSNIAVPNDEVADLKRQIDELRTLVATKAPTERRV